MEELIRQIRVASENGLYYLALYGALVLPDICAGLASDTGTTSGPKYKGWLMANVPEHANQADMIWKLRCSLLHEGSAYPHGDYNRLAFTIPGTAQLHNFTFQGYEESWGEVALLSIPIFVSEVTEGVENWLRLHGSSENVIRNMEKFARLRPEGIPPHLIGPLIA